MPTNTDDPTVGLLAHQPQLPGGQKWATHFKRIQSGGRGEVAITGQFGPEEVAWPDGGLRGGEAPQETPKLLVVPFRLAVGLRVIA